MPYWMSIEVLDGASPASLWADTHGDALVEAALSSGASDWAWHRHTWGVVFEVAFADQEAWERYRALLVVQTALDAVPDPHFGLIIARGRGGSAGTRDPRRRPLLSGSGAAVLPIPLIEALEDDVWRALPRELERARLATTR